MNTQSKGVAYLVIATVLYSIMPVLIRTLGRGNIPPVSQVFLRYIVAFIAAVIYFTVTKSVFKVARKDMALLFIVALFGYALVNLFYTFANLNTQIGTVLFIFNCSTIMGPFLGYLFLKERLSRSMILAMGIGFISLFFLFSPGPMVNWKIGAIFALLSALGSSLYVIGRKKLSSYDSIIILLANTSVGVITLGILSLVLEPSFYLNGGIQTISWSTWLVTLLFGLDNFAAYLCMTKGFQLLTAGTGSMILLGENLIGILFAFLFFREIPSTQSLIGGTLILLASFLVIRTQLVRSKPN
jgi:drug/metabolite transporter (DMT)-like permease